MKTARIPVWSAVMLLIITVTASAQMSHGNSSSLSIDELRLTTGFKKESRMLGDENRGDYWARKIEVLMESSHRTLLNFSLQSFDYNQVNLMGLDANARIVDLGITIPANSKVSVRTVYNSWTEYGTNEATDAGGIYLDWRANERWRLEMATEMFFSKAPELYYVTSEYQVPENWPLVSCLYSGFSRQYIQTEGQPHHFGDRLAVGAMVPLGSWQINWGISTRIDSVQWNQDARAWNIGLALPVDYSNHSPWAPGFYMNYREKPGSRYLMILGSFGGYAFNTHVISALYRSNHRALNIPTRVVNNQNFDIRVLNTHSQEFGRISCSFIRFEFDVTDDLPSQSIEGSLYYTHTPLESGIVTQPFIGYTYSKPEDISYSFFKHQLESIGHTQHIVNFGGRLRLWSQGGSSDDAGMIRLSFESVLGSSGIEGVSFASTVWF